MEAKERKLIGRGRVSSIFSDGINAYKTYPSHYSIEWIKLEYLNQREIYEKTKLPVLKYEWTENSREIKMDIINGVSLADRIRKQKYQNGLDDLINIQKSIYEYAGLNIPSAFVSFNKIIIDSNLDKEIKEKALASLYSVENKDVLCHFDLHFENIMYDKQQHYIIDWVNVKLGNPVLDIARSYIILKQYAMRLANKYLVDITQELNISKTEVLKSIPIMAALRILENEDDSFNKTLVELIHKN